VSEFPADVAGLDLCLTQGASLPGQVTRNASVGYVRLFGVFRRITARRTTDNILSTQTFVSGSKGREL